MFSTSLMDDMQYEGFSHTARLVYFAIVLHEQTQLSGIMEYDFYDIAKRMGFTKRDENLLADSISELRSAGWLWIDGAWMFAPKMRDGFDGLREYKQKSHVKKMLDWIGSERNIAIDKFLYTYSDVIGLVKSDEEFEKYLENEQKRPNENTEIRTEGVISVPKSEERNENAEIRTENIISVPNNENPNENIDSRNQNAENDDFLSQELNVSLLSLSSSALEGDGKEISGVVLEKRERGAGKTKRENSPAGHSGDLLSRCVEQGVERGFAERCIAERNAVQWHDATGGVISDRVRYVQAAFRKRNSTATPQNHTDKTTSMVSTKNGLKTSANGKTQNGTANGDIDRQKLFEMSLDEVIASAGSPARNGVAA